MSRYSDSSLMSGLGRRRRGRGVGSIIGSIADHIFGLGRKKRRTYRRRYRRRRPTGLGRRRRYHRRGCGYRRRYHKRRIGGMMGIQMGMRRKRYHRRHRGRGILDKLKSAGSFALPVVASAILGKAGSAIGSKIFGHGKRHHYRHHHHRRTGRGILL